MPIFFTSALPANSTNTMIGRNLLCCIIFIYSAISSASSPPSHHRFCDPELLPNATNLRPDQLTVLISGFSVTRIPILRSIASSYASSPTVAAVLILWFNPQTPSETLAQSLSFPSPNVSSSSSAPISIIRHRSSSLNGRFLPRTEIRTRSVAVCDDDVRLPISSLEFAFRIWRSDPRRLVGFFPRSHSLDLSLRRWIYTVHPDRYSMVLTKFVVLDERYLRRYSCADDYREMRAVVDRARNCEDILMNFVVAHEAGVGPVLVGTGGVRDWGDMRNAGAGDVGISGRGKGHMERRGECLNEFHGELRRMPLRYSYGKVVKGVDQTSICEKSGRLVPCDRSR